MAFHPEAVLSAHALDPARFRFSFTTFAPELGMGVGSLSCHYGEEYVGSIELHRDQPSPRCRSVHPLIRDLGRFKHHGVGTMMYLLAAKLVHDRQGALLGYDKTEASEAAKSLWRRLFQAGYATPQRRFRTEALTSDAFGPLLQYAAGRTEVRHETRESFYGVPDAYRRYFDELSSKRPVIYQRAFDDHMLRWTVRERPGDPLYADGLRRLKARYPELHRIHRQILRDEGMATTRQGSR